MRRTFLRRSTLGKFEVADARAPVEAGRRRVVLVCVIERAIVHRIDREIAVIAPAIGRSTLAPGAIKKVLFTCQNVYGIGHQTSRIAELRVNRAAGGAETKYLVSQVIRRDAAHPAPGGIRLIRALLEDTPVPRLRALQFKPAYSGHCIGTHRVIIKQRFMTVGEPAIGVAEH